MRHGYREESIRAILDGDLRVRGATPTTVAPTPRSINTSRTYPFDGVWMGAHPTPDRVYFVVRRFTQRRSRQTGRRAPNTSSSLQTEQRYTVPARGGCSSGRCGRYVLQAGHCQRRGMTTRQGARSWASSVASTGCRTNHNDSGHCRARRRRRAQADASAAIHTAGTAQTSGTAFS